MDNIVNCPAGDCTGVGVDLGTKVITFATTTLDNNNPFGPPTVFATLSGTIQYP